MQRIFITGICGFVGSNLALYFQSIGNQVYGIDDLNKYYDINLKKDRLYNLKKYSKKFHFYKIDISNLGRLKNNFSKKKYDYVVNLAAQAGVRHSIKNPSDYLNRTIIGFFNHQEQNLQRYLRNQPRYIIQIIEKKEYYN